MKRALRDAPKRELKLFRKKEGFSWVEGAEGAGSWADLPETLLTDISRRLELADFRCGVEHTTAAFDNVAGPSSSTKHRASSMALP